MQKGKVNKESLGRIWKLIQPYKSAFYTCTILAILVAPLTAIKPYLINMMTNDFVAGTGSQMTKLTIIYLLALLGSVIVRYFFIYQTNFLGQDLIRDLRTTIFNHLSSLHQQYFDQTPVGQSTTRTINDTETINSMVSQGIIPMIGDALTLIAVVIAMFFTSVKLTLVSLAVLPLLIYSSKIFTQKVRVAYQKLRAELAKMNSFLQERITGMQVVQIFNAEEKEMDKFKSINRAYTQENINNIFYYAVFLPVVEILSALTLAIMVWWGARDVLSNDISLGALVAFPLFLSQLFRPIRMLADKFNYLQLGIVATERVFEALNIQNEIPDLGTHSPENITGHVEFKNVEFEYLTDEPILRDISFEIPAGQTMAIVGSTGSGKTTVINLLSRLYDIQKGAILIDNRDVKEYSMAHLREKMAVVLQDVFLFGGSIYDNIRLMDSNITDDEIIEASKTIGAHRFFKDLPDGYNFQVMERGGNLSMGQRQLISFVRALVFNPSILILDEATSSIDVETESVIQNAIEKLIKKRTSIIIAHRLSTIKNADQILVLNKGKIIQKGTHTELLKDTSGVYFELQQMQLKSAEV